MRRRWKPDVLQETRGKSEGKASKAFLILPPTAIPSGSVKQGDRIFILCICFAGLPNAQLFLILSERVSPKDLIVPTSRLS